jgi:hypothetical protein
MLFFYGAGHNDFDGPTNGFARIKIIKSKRQIEKKYIGNFMYMSCKAHPFQWPQVL